MVGSKANNEIFLGELLRLSAEALDKITLVADKSKLDGQPKLFIRITPDKSNNTLTIVDNGIGMTKTDLLNNLGPSDGGFYSAFLVADKVSVTTKHNGDEQYVGEARDGGPFSVTSDTSGKPLGRGTKMTLYLKDDQLEYLEEQRLNELVTKYSHSISYPITLFGHRKGDGEMLKRALTNFLLAFLKGRGVEEVDPKEEKEDMLQSILVYLLEHNGGMITLDKAEKLPVRHLLVHQLKKVEQFCITGPNDSYAMLEEMMKNFQEFYIALKLPHRVMTVVSGALDNASAKTLRLEGWFPRSQGYGELVSVSNCTDYATRALDMQDGHYESCEDSKQYVHVLCSSLTLEGTLSCIIETYQRENGVVEVPEALKSFVGGYTFLPF